MANLLKERISNYLSADNDELLLWIFLTVLKDLRFFTSIYHADLDSVTVSSGLQVFHILTSDRVLNKI